MKTIAIIPARAGSQGLPGKNYRKFMGKPLVQHTMEQALAIFSKEEIVISSNCPNVLQIAMEMGWKDVIPRPDY
ncbi:MAG: acylneuraminate cytidylyltransferase family protein, partial [Bacteroidetes bacterium]|nr:acylneuraminate cytidylyltransferase family protein [Bacteroidota bacterium]